jgi:DNA-binding transcriptional ArsR family regulator
MSGERRRQAAPEAHVVSTRLRKDRYLLALVQAAPLMTPEVQRAVPVALALALSANSDGANGCLSGVQLARLLSYGVSDRTAGRHLRALREAGWLMQTERGGRRGNKAFASKYALSEPVPTGHLDGRLESGPNRPRLTLQPATQVAASSPRGLAAEQVRSDTTPSGLTAYGGRPSLSLDEAAAMFGQVEDNEGVNEGVFSELVRMVGPDAAARAAVKAGWFCKPHEDGWPATGDTAVDEAFFYSAVLADAQRAADEADEGTTVDLNQWAFLACRDAARAAAKQLAGESPWRGWAAVYGLVYYESRPPSAVKARLALNKDGSPVVGGVALRRSVAELIHEFDPEPQPEPQHELASEPQPEHAPWL